MITIKLDSNAHDKIKLSANGKGGYQNLLQKLQSQYNETTRGLELTENDLETLKRYAAANCGQGGFQGKFNAILKCYNP